MALPALTFNSLFIRHTLPFLAEDKAAPVTEALFTIGREMMEKIENPEPPGLISSPVYGLCDDTVETFKKLAER